MNEIIVVEPIVPIIEVTAPGPQGNDANAFYTHTQTTPSTLWTINHGLGGYTNAVVLNSVGNMSIGVFAYPTINTMTIAFNQAISGVAHLQ